MKFRLSIFPAAENDVDAAARFIAQDNLAAALRFYDSVDSTYCQILDHPTRWPRYELDDARLANLRRRSVVKFPKYLVFYRIDEQRVEVIRVLHGARDIGPTLLAELSSD
jgi:toxin ParE1/3/4